jgi:DNA polymerase/3'-5' exonuclease PolX
MELQNALSIAGELVESLSPYCEIINVAGSCRRSRPMVKDIEIVCLSKTKIIREVFGEELKRVRTKEFVGVVESLGERFKGSTIDGKYNKIKLKQGIMLDLFLPQSFDYYRIFAIRTGSDDYSKKVLAGGWRKKGWCGSDAGLRKTRDCRETKTSKGASTWKCVNPEAELPPVWKSEKDFFDWINVKWVEPSLRNI